MKQKLWSSQVNDEIILYIFTVGLFMDEHLLFFIDAVYEGITASKYHRERKCDNTSKNDRIVKLGGDT